MTNIKLIFLFLLLSTFPLKATEIKIIELHKNKSLDQLVLESENINNIDNNNEDIVTSESGKQIVTDEILVNSNLNLEGDQNESIAKNDDLNSNEEVVFENSGVVKFIKSEEIFDIDENIIINHLETINKIKSKSLNNEFIKILSGLELSDQKNNSLIYFIIKKLYEIGEIGKAYSLIKNVNIDKISNKEHLVYFQVVELNYLLSTFKLTEVCELKAILLDKALVLPEYLLEKTDIFCLTLENKFAEAKLLNSLLADSESEIDKNFQELFNFMIYRERDKLVFNSLKPIKSKELIFLYSAMLRINELPLDEDFISIDPINLSIPVILSDSTKMPIRIKAANRAFYDDVISIDSLSALYQSVDYNSKEFNTPDQSILSLKNNNELIMSFYYQLANIQIFPEDRLKVILDYWKFAKNIGLEKIAYAITKNIIETFTPTSENTKYGIEIALAHISNKNYLEASKWVNIIENSDAVKDQVDYLRFLITLHESDELETIINYLANNNYKIDSKNNQKTLETMEILISFLNIKRASDPLFSYYNIIDNRLMPSYFLIQDIKKNMQIQKDLTLFFLSLLSMNNKNWDELHPEHLSLILNAFNSYDQGSLIKPIILEILNDLEIIK